ncbi:MAG: 16S rRNA (cytosine(1402)-N(4))-methyltransferase RsmH [Methylococcaceae bacterium]
MTQPELHTPVMLSEVLEGLALSPDAFVVDCTFGRGGHSRAILDKLGCEGRLLALDKDPTAIESEEAMRLRADSRFMVRHGSFADLAMWVAGEGRTGQVSAVLMDLGVSSPQLDEATRGFSFMREGPLDMRMDTSAGITASQWISEVSETELIRVLREFGEERYARRIAAAVVRHRKAQPLTTTRSLVRIIEQAVPNRDIHKHPATRTFQAIRLAINGDLDVLKRAQSSIPGILGSGGRWVVIAFHSLEDRLVKRIMRDQELGQRVDPRLPIQTESTGLLKRIGKARLPSEEEIRLNPIARSAVLRIDERR